MEKLYATYDKLGVTIALLFCLSSVSPDAALNRTTNESLSSIDDVGVFNLTEPSFNVTENITEWFNWTESDQNQTIEPSVPATSVPTTTDSSELQQWEEYPKSTVPVDNMPCTCDLTTDTCDVNCCCDKQCLEEDRKAFTECGMPHFQADERYCFKEDFIFMNNTPYVAKKTSNNLFCIYTDNYQKRFQYNDVAVVVNSTKFDTYTERYLAYSWPQISGGKFVADLKVGSPIYVVFDSDKSIGYLPMLRDLATGECISSNPVPYMEDGFHQCHQFLKNVQEDCVNNIWLSAETYYRNFKILIDPSILKNPANNITSDNLIEVVPKICHDIFGLNDESCNSSDEVDPAHIPTPLYNATLGTCENVISRVEYHIAHNGTHGIFKAWVHLSFRSVKASKELETSPVKWIQSYSVAYEWFTTRNASPSENPPLRWSGNPGYQLGAPILAGKLVLTEDGDSGTPVVKTGVRLARDPSSWLTVAGAPRGGGGRCVSRSKGSAAGNGRLPVLFGEELKTGCLLVVSSRNLTDICSVLQTSALDALLGWDPPDVVGAYGNSRPEKPGEWVPVLVDTPPSPSRPSSSGKAACTNVVQELFVEILHARFGSFANPQSKIVGVRLRFGPYGDLRIHCVGRYCQAGAEQLTQTVPVTTSVIFVDVSDTAVVVYAEPPTVHVELPYDFFYPFISRSSHVRSSIELLVTVALIILYLRHTLE